MVGLILSDCYCSLFLSLKIPHRHLFVTCPFGAVPSSDPWAHSRRLLWIMCLIKFSMRISQVSRCRRTLCKETDVVLLFPDLRCVLCFTKEQGKLFLSLPEESKVKWLTVDSLVHVAKRRPDWTDLTPLGIHGVTAAFIYCLRGPAPSSCLLGWSVHLSPPTYTVILKSLYFCFLFIVISS